MDEERALYLAMIVTGSPPFAVVLAKGTEIGVGPTLAGLVLGLGVLGLVRSFVRPSRLGDTLLPRARLRKRHS